jgi:hypothetical protein
VRAGAAAFVLVAAWSGVGGGTGAGAGSGRRTGGVGAVVDGATDVVVVVALVVVALVVVALVVVALVVVALDDGVTSSSPSGVT